MKGYKRLYFYSFQEAAHQNQICMDITPEGKLCGTGYFIQTSNRFQYDQQNFHKKRKTEGICLFCGEIDWSVLQQHHPDPVKLPDFAITLCANCHARLHFLTGGNIRAQQ